LQHQELSCKTAQHAAAQHGMARPGTVAHGNLCTLATGLWQIPAGHTQVTCRSVEGHPPDRISTRTLSTSASGTMLAYVPAMSKSHWKNSLHKCERGTQKCKGTFVSIRHHAGIHARIVKVTLEKLPAKDRRQKCDGRSAKSGCGHTHTLGLQDPEVLLS
jgi:hypothetical protein